MSDIYNEIENIVHGLVGYKGKMKYESATFYCPYVPLTSFGVIDQTDNYANPKNCYE